MHILQISSWTWSVSHNTCLGDNTREKKVYDVSCSFFFEMPFTCTLAIGEIAKAFKTSLAMSSLLTDCPFHFTHPFEDKNYYLNLLKQIIS